MIDRGLSFGEPGGEETPPQFSDTVNVAPVEGKLKILFLAANPEGKTQLKLAEEYRNILNHIKRAEYRDRIELTTRPALRHDDLRLALLEEKPHIVHFSGHGSNQDQLILQNDQGDSHPVSRESVAGVVQDS